MLRPVFIAVESTDPGLPVSLPDMKAHLRVDHDLDDVRIQGMILAGAHYLQMKSNVSVLQRTLLARFEGFADRMRLLRGPVAAVTDVFYYDDAGVQQAVDPASWAWDVCGPTQAVLWPASRQWPSPGARPQPVGVRYRAGWQSDQVPEEIRQALRLLVSHWYDNPQAAGAAQQNAEIAFGVESLLAPWRDRGLV